MLCVGARRTSANRRYGSDALGQRDDDYLIARAIQFFAPGVPQVYYVGLLAGANDMDLLRHTGVGRDINRHYYTCAELKEGLQAPWCVLYST